MRLLLVGGQLQGVEAAYLAKEAGWDVTLVDRWEAPLAALLCDEFVHTNAMSLSPEFLSRFDLVFPAVEETQTLSCCKSLCEQVNVPFAFDAQAYRTSSSKAATNRFLEGCGAATPPALDRDADAAWPGGYVVKPDSESGSAGVERYATREEALAALERRPGCIGQAFVEGPVLSIEVVCDHADVRPFVVTEVVVGNDYDCHRIVAPAEVDEQTGEAIRDVALRIGRALDMRGIFDIELVMHDGVPYVLEIDARFPSQTPIAIYHATGINLFAEVARVFCVDSSDIIATARARKHAILQHVRVADGASAQFGTEFIGECRLKGARPLEREARIPGADMTLVARGRAGNDLYFTLVSSGDIASQAERRMRVALSAITRKGAVA